MVGAKVSRLAHQQGYTAGTPTRDQTYSRPNPGRQGLAEYQKRTMGNVNQFTIRLQIESA